MTIVEITGGMLRAVAQYVSAYDARGDSEMLSTDFCRGVIPPTSWRVVYKSFSASSRNSSGTDRDNPNMTDPYPTASHPKRSRIASTIAGGNLICAAPDEISLLHQACLHWLRRTQLAGTSRTGLAWRPNARCFAVSTLARAELDRRTIERGVSFLKLAACCLTEVCRAICFGLPQAMSIASLRARSLLTFRCRRRPNTSLSSIS